MFNLTNKELEEYIHDDIPYFDITTSLQNEKNRQAKLSIFTREDIMVSCSEEAKRVAELLNCHVQKYVPSKTSSKKGESILEFTGAYEDVHKAWRVCQILLEYSCKIATYTHDMNQKIKAINPSCELLATRKTFPFAKRFCIKSILNGGAFPHRLGLSESILFFENHRILYETNKDFYKAIYDFKIKVPEKKIVVESSTLEDMKQLMEYGVDVIQIDKASLEVIAQAVEHKNRYVYESVKLLATGGIHLNNVEAFAKTKVDGIVTSSLYNAGSANLGSTMTLI
ncbi:MAG: ModD protein [Arcobacteraceae bacterium]